MLFIVLGGIVGFVLSLVFGVNTLIGPYSDVILSFVMLALVVIVGALSGGLIGYLISLFVGVLFPQISSKVSYQIGSLEEKSHIQNQIIKSGNSTIIIPRYYTTYEYTYYSDGQYIPGSVLTTSASIKQHDKNNVTLVVTSWSFPQKWMTYLASPSISHYTFYVPYENS